MVIRFTVKIKPEQNPPVFKDSLGTGVLEVIDIDFKNISEEDLNEPMVCQKILSIIQDLKNNWIDVDYELLANPDLIP